MWCWSRGRIRRRIGEPHGSGGDDAGGVGQDDRAAVAHGRAVLADWMEGDGRRCAVGRCGAHAAIITAPGMPSSPRCVRVIAPRRWPGCGRWPRAGRRRGWWLRMKAPGGPGTVFVYSGQGSQWAGMGRQLLADEPAFAAAVAELEPVFVEQVGFSLRQVLAAGEPVVGIDRIQPVLVGMQLALTDAVALLRGGTRCGDRAFDGGGDRGGGGRGAEPGRGAAGDRHPVAVDVAAVRARRDGAAGTGRGGRPRR